MARTPALAKKKKFPVHHAHGCLQCGRRYTDTCSTPQDNGVCLTCQSGQEVPFWDRDRAPQWCCRIHSRVITTAELIQRYALGGPGPWFICGVCSRTHPFDPTGAIA